MLYVQITQTGFEIKQGGNPVVPFIAITESQREQLMNGTHTVSNGQIVLAPVPVPNVAIERISAHAAIDAQAGTTRRKYITDATGQDATYLQKAAEAKAYVAAGYPSASIASYPMVRAMARSKYGPTPSAAQCQLAADYIIATEAAWVQKGADIEEARLAGKDAVTAALTVADVQTAQTAAIAALVAL